MDEPLPAGTLRSATGGQDDDVAFSARKRPNGTITGRLHLNFSYQTIGYGYQISLVGYVCQGDATFKAKPIGRG